MKRTYSIVAAALLSYLPACAAEDTGSAPLIQEAGHHRATTIPTSEGAFAELVDVRSEAVVAALDWDGHSATVELDIDDSKTAIDLGSPPVVDELNEILLSNWYQTTFQVDSQAGQAGKADSIQGFTRTICDGSKATFMAQNPAYYLTHSQCAAECRNECGYDSGWKSSTYAALGWPPFYLTYCQCTN